MTPAPCLRSVRLGVGVLLVLAGALLCLAVSPVAADPPPWAPAHGWRAGHGKHEQRHRYRDDHVRYEWRERHRGHGDEYRERVEYRRATEPTLSRAPDSRCGFFTGLVGAAAGGALGAQFGGGDGQLATTAAGTLLGYLVGSGIGRSMDYADRDCLGRTLERVPDAQTVAWRNPNADAFYRVTPYESYRSEGRYCREYTVRAVVAGRQQQAFGIACRQPDGSWQIVR